MAQLAPIAAPSLVSAHGIRHAFFTRAGGVSRGLYETLNAGLGSDDDRAAVIENRGRMAKYLGVAASQLASPYQVHSPDVVVTREAWSKDRPRADAVVTDREGLAVGVVTADCGPVLFADSAAGVVAAAHAGWKGALGGVLENTIEQMIDLGARPESITAVLGPTISQASYEVGPDFPEAFLKRDAAWTRYFAPSGKADHHMFDLVAFIIDRLTSRGVTASSVDRCTYLEEDLFYSYRRTTHRQEPDYGRQLSAIVLQPPQG